MELKGYITNLEDYNAGRLNGEWIEFPADEEEIAAALERIGCADGTEYFFSDWESDILSPSDLGEYISIDEVNNIYDNLAAWDEDALNAAIEAFGVREVMDADPNDFVFMLFVENDYDLGYHYAEECGMLHDVADVLKNYFDYETYGRDIRLETDGAHTAYGWIERIY